MPALFLAQGLRGCICKVWVFRTLEFGLSWAAPGPLDCAVLHLIRPKEIWTRSGCGGKLFFLQANHVPFVCPGLDASPPASTHELTIPNDVSIPPAHSTRLVGHLRLGPCPGHMTSD
uniref:MutS homolog 4 variant epsilon 1 n=1 Tax=Mus musculus TaxID=10090 RepID=Q7TNA4_MOUSE|nr:MutS homolog 4 variant epsilon 1 [Mus musculus]